MLGMLLFISQYALSIEPLAINEVDSILIHLKEPNSDGDKTQRSTLLRRVVFEKNLRLYGTAFYYDEQIDSLYSMLMDFSATEELDYDSSEEKLKIKKDKSFNLSTCGGFKTTNNEDVCGFLAVYINKKRYFIWINENSIDFNKSRYSIDNIAMKLWNFAKAPHKDS